jgi:hypothetical protein
MSKDLGKRLAILRLIPIIVLIIVAFGLEYGFGVSRLSAAGTGLAIAILTRLILVRVWS